MFHINQMILTSSKKLVPIVSYYIRSGFVNEALLCRSLMCWPALCNNVDSSTDNLVKHSACESKREPVATKFVNRNPRNLEFLGIEWKRKGWKFQYPSREYYHRLLFDRSQRQTAAYVEHSSGKRIVTASTREVAIMRHLYSNNDVSAAENIGRVIAQRCFECGITSMVLEPLNNTDKSEKFAAFCKAVKDGGIELSEIDEVVPPYEPGIDYDDPEAIADLQRRQRLVYELGEKSATTRALADQQRTRGRRRPRNKPIELEAPSWRAD